MQQFEWIVVGAGPAGISTVGTLLDCGVDPGGIAWIDPAFGAGDLGALWGNVPSNTRVGDFYAMFEACRSFEFDPRAMRFTLDRLPKDGWCDLRYVAEPLQTITRSLRAKVRSIADYVTGLEAEAPGRVLQLRGGGAVQGRNVVLAVGAVPRALDLSGMDVIPLEVAMDRERLPAACGSRDTVAVFGSSHSAVLAMMILIESCDVAGVVNFYRSPPRYAVQFADARWAYYDTGLKGTVAAWGRRNLGSDALPRKLQRYLVNGGAPATQLARCTRAVAAIGFEPRMNLKYDPSTGVIGPGLFGCGFAFPEIAPDEFGEPVQRVGLIRFARYLARVVPMWLSRAR